MRTRIEAAEPEGNEPEEIAAWVAAGFSVEDAEVWRRWRFTIAQAEAWQAVGVGEGLHAAQWSTAGVGPETVKSWRDSGIEASEAVRWHEMGCDADEARAEKRKGNGPEEAFSQSHPRQGGGSGVVRTSRLISQQGMLGTSGPIQAFHQSGGDPRVIHSYLQHQWFDEEAMAWATRGIEAADAYTWHEIGLTPDEAGRLALQGRMPGEVIREWWSAGIPFDEVAEWIGAGLSAREAVDQRAKGITAEQAAALRALRREEGVPQRDPTLRPELLGRQGPPGSERPGPSPDDEEAARAEIEHAFECMLEVEEGSNALPMVDGGSNLASCLAEAGARHGVDPDQSARTVSVDSLRFINDHEARVIYSIVISGPFSFNPMLRGRQGKATLVEGEWKVARETFCMFMQLAGVECPPREG
jgi:hypothetical protein